jgi:tetratricopeptide (TPR) repeat protein
MPQQHLTTAQASQLQSAHQLMQKGRLEDAQHLVDTVLASAPKQTDALHLKALVLHRAGQHTGAEQLFKRILRTLPDHAHVLGSYANLLGDMQKWKPAFDIYAKLAASSPHDGQVWVNWGITALAAQQHAVALEKLTRAATLMPRSAGIQCTIGDVHRALHDTENAEAAYRHSLALDNNFARSHMNIALVLRETERGQEALAHYENARKLGVSAGLVDMGEAFALSDMDDVPAALSKFNSVIAQEPDNIDARVALAKLQWKSGLTQSPLETLVTALETQLDNLPLWFATLKLAGEARLYGEMLPLLDRAEKVMGQTADLSEARAVALSETGNLEAAQTLFEHLKKAAPFSAGQHALYARHLLKCGDPQDAATACELALRQQPDLLIAQSYLGTAWRLLGDVRETWLHAYDAHVTPVMLQTPAGFSGMAEFMAALQYRLTHLHKAKREPLEQSLRGGTQTSGQILNRHEPEIVALRQSMEHAIAKTIAALPVDSIHPFLKHRPADPARFRFNGSWSVQLSAQGFHVNHMHSHGWISSACYIALPETVDDGTQGWIQFGSPPVELGLDLPARRLIKPEPGLLVLFPSSMWHGTLPFSGQHKRLSVAFDVVPR